MGLAASQARLLTITARLADNELRSQTINNAKMRLATQSSQASENYINALNNAIYKFTNYDDTGAINNQQLTFNALTAYSSYNTQYGLINAAGQILVSEEEGRLFEKSQGNLDAYLKEHGLEYKTTYFNGKEFTNNTYPEPFNHIVDTDSGNIDGLKTMYERYTSYETSVEVEKFENAFANYKASNAYIEKAGSEILEKILMSETNTDKLKIENNSYNLVIADNVSGANALVDTFKKAFLSNNNYYNLETLKSKNYITQETYDRCNSIVNSFNVSSTGISMSESVNVTVEDTKDENDVVTGKKYNIDELIVYVGTDGIVTKYEDDKFKKEFGENEFSWDENKLPQTGVTIETFINNIQFTYQNKDESGNSNPLKMKFSCTKDANNNLVVKNNYEIRNEKDQKEYIQSSVDNIINIILSDANYTKLFDDIVKGQNIGISPNTVVTNDNKTIQDLATGYSDSLNNYINVIFSKDCSSIVADDVKTGAKIDIKDEEGNIIEQKTLTPENLQDIDFILQYIAQNDNITPSESFETVIKKFIIDEVIEEYGTPNYAWVDSNDPNNTQNADAKAQWYTNLFNRMTRGYKTLEDGLASSVKWIEYALENGTVYLEQVDKSFLWKAMDYKTCSRITEETDDVAVAKAEAEYNRAMKDIENKDNIYDLELKNIDTEHNALQTEYDVIKGVISKNIERNFKFNQSA